MSSLFTCMCVSALSVLVGGCETPQQHIDDVPIAGSIIDPPLLSCENHCEVRFADGVCRLDVTCLFAASSPASSSFLDGGASGAASERSFCRGHCVFEDTEGSCRLDLICLLQRDAAATREFLEQFGVYEEEVVEALALTGELGRLSSSRKEMRGETQCDQQTTPSAQTQQEKEEEEEDEKRRESTHRIVKPPALPCPGRCEVRNRLNECVEDFDCASEL